MLNLEDRALISDHPLVPEEVKNSLLCDQEKNKDIISRGTTHTSSFNLVDEDIPSISQNSPIKIVQNETGAPLRTNLDFRLSNSQIKFKHS